MSVPLLARVERWHCPNCPATDTTKGLAANAVRFHPCPGLCGLTAPLLRAAVDAKVEPVERGDYVGGELVQTDDDGRPWMAVRTTRADGSNDLAVLAPTAQASLRGDR